MFTKYLEILAATLPVFILLGAGWLVRVKAWMAPEADRSLLRLLINCFFPCLLMDKILGNKAAMDWGKFSLAPALGFGLVVTGFALSYVAGKRLGFTRDAGLRTFSLTTGIFNYGYLAIPVTLALFPGGGVTSLLMVFNLGVELAVWTVGLSLLVGGKGGSRAFWKNAFNGPVIAILGAVTINQMGLEPVIPEWTRKTFAIFGQCAIPLGVMISGAALADAARDVAIERNPRVPFAGVLLRLGLLPAIFLALACLLPFSPELKKVIITQAAMPAGIFPVVLAKHHGGEPGVALQIIVATSIVGFFTLPFWLMLGLHLIGQ